MLYTNSTRTCYFLAVNLEHSPSVLGANIVTSVLNCLLALSATCGNSFVVLIILRREALQNPSNVLLSCLAISDLVVGLVSQPSFVIFKVAEMNGHFNTYCAARMVQSCSGWLTASVSLLTLSAISVDRYLALRLHLRYATIVTVPRVINSVAVFWLICTASVALRFVMTSGKWNSAILSALLFVVVVTFTCYFNIFKTVRRHKRQIQNSFKLAVRLHGQSGVEFVRHKKATLTMLYVLCVFCLCYVPFLGAIAAEIILGYTLSVKIAYDFTATIVFLSSSLNPVLYCWRIRDIRRAAVDLIKQARGDVSV